MPPASRSWATQRVQVGEAPAGQPHLEVAVAGQPPCLRDASLGAQVRLETVRVHAGSQPNPYQRVQPARIPHAGTETGRLVAIRPGSTWIRVTPSGASISFIA